MTIAIAVRTSSALVFAADSKLTTNGLAGVDANGELRWVQQTYDNATKVVQNRAGMMAMVAGDANVGRTAALDFIEMWDGDRCTTRATQSDSVASLFAGMVEEKRKFWSATTAPPSDWPGPTVMLGAADPEERVPRVWLANLSGEQHTATEVLTEPGILMEGAYLAAFNLMYGWHLEIASGLADALGISGDEMLDKITSSKALRPVDQINLNTMPIQDAIELAVFLCTVQVEMDRFLPGEPRCGGAIDVMVLRTVPIAEILSYPGKTLHHPHVRAKLNP